MNHWTVSYDDDGWGSVLRAGPDGSPKDLLREAVDSVVQYSIDTFVWNVEEQVVPSRSDVAQDRQAYGNAVDWMLRQRSPQVFEHAPRTVVEAVRKKGVNGFLGFRVNDPHDRHRPWLRPTLKLDHPEYQLGGGYLPLPIARSFEGPRWACYNFVIEEVPDFKLSLIQDILRNPYDGLFLDFFRHPFFFNPADVERGWEILTEWMEEIRGLVRQKPLWVRVPADLSICRWAGIDLREWIRRGLVDTVVSGGGNIIFDQPSFELVDYCHTHDVEVQLCVDVGVSRHTYARQRAAARAAYAKGLDGIYMFNMYIPGRDWREPGEQHDYSVLGDLVDPKRLDTVPKIYAIEVREERPINTHFEPQGRVPFQLTHVNASDGYSLQLFVGDSLSRPGLLDKGLLKLEMSEIAVFDDEVEIWLNGCLVGGDSGQRGTRGPTTPDAGALVIVSDVTEFLQSGMNELSFVLKQRVPDVLTNVTVTKIELELTYV